MKTSVKRRAKNCIRGTVLLACFIAVWYVASCLTQPLFIPAPATVWEAIVGLAETGQLQKGLAYSFLRITGASALSMLVAIPLSLLIYGVKPIKETIMPVVSFLRYVPVTAFSPLLILWFGIGEQMKISFLFIATFVYLFVGIVMYFIWPAVQNRIYAVGSTARSDGYGQDNRNDQLGDNQRNSAPRIAPFNIQYVPYDVWHWLDILRRGRGNQR